MAELIPVSFSHLLKRIYYEYTKNNAIFDLPSRKFYRPSSEVDLSVSFCGNKAANPVGPAAGPQTQLAQNIILSWLAGSRILELKTVQIKDRLQLTRPCIDMATIGYNTEWSQELRLEESLREYVKASMIVEILQKAFQGSGFKFQDKPETYDVNLETIFDISIGYDLAGIQSKEIRRWLQTILNASALIEEYRKEIPPEFATYRGLPFKFEIGNSITLSTFHGTPADEIERICEFLLTEMDFHVIIKLNPPMLGKEQLEYLLHEKLGYTEVEVHQKAYESSISFDDAVLVMKRLQSIAAKNGKNIGVKFGNTLEVINRGEFLKDKIQYLSGQPLHILHLALVKRWREIFGADFPISFSAGVDANNFADCVTIGLVPITTCTDLLRPGGYGRLPQYLINLEREMKKLSAFTIENFILKTARGINPHSQIPNFKSAVLLNTSNLLEKSINNPRYHYQQNKKPPRKIGSHLHLWDCINCDKCIPVCPNDANFYFEVEPVEFHYKNIEIVNSTWREVDGGIFKIEEKHQIATFADACNDCGNCDVFCPEDGGPYIEKPRFFGSLDSWKRWKTLSGFFLMKEQEDVELYGRFKEKEFKLVWENMQHARFSLDECSMIIDWSTDKILGAESKSKSENVVVNMGYYFTMKTLLKSMMDTTRIHFVNAGILFR